MSLPLSATWPPKRRIPASRSPILPSTRSFPIPLPTSFLMAEFFPCGCLVTDDSTGYDCGAAGRLTDVPAADGGSGATSRCVEGSCFLACPCGNLVFMHTVPCAYFGVRGVPAAARSNHRQSCAALAAGSAAPAVASAQTDAAASVDDGRALSLTRDGLCVVSSCVRPRNDTCADDEVVVAAEKVSIRPM